jgi:hypothetical protein
MFGPVHRSPAEVKGPLSTFRPAVDPELAHLADLDLDMSADSFDVVAVRRALEDLLTFPLRVPTLAWCGSTVVGM